MAIERTQNELGLKMSQEETDGIIKTIIVTGVGIIKFIIETLRDSFKFMK